jgi:hypothetical protein
VLEQLPVLAGAQLVEPELLRVELAVDVVQRISSAGARRCDGPNIPFRSPAFSIET